VIRVALIDSGAAERHRARIAAGRAFRLAEGEASAGAGTAHADGFESIVCGALAHGPALADVLLGEARVELVVARVFFESLATSALQLAAALDWAVEQGAALANVSAGLREPRDVLAAAVARARGRGVAIVAASPARGAAVFPAAYPGVVRATGDARCAPGEWSWLGNAQAEFGAHARAGDVRGASAGCARVAAELARRLAAGAPAERALAEMRERAHYRGPERRER
jgi:subtilisin family serine protease